MSSSFPYSPTIPQSGGSIILDDMSTCKLVSEIDNVVTSHTNNTIAHVINGANIFFMMLSNDEMYNMTCGDYPNYVQYLNLCINVCSLAPMILNL